MFSWLISVENGLNPPSALHAARSDGLQTTHTLYLTERNGLPLKIIEFYLWQAILSLFLSLPFSCEVDKHHRVQWDQEFRFSVKMYASASTGELDPCYCKISIKKVTPFKESKRERERVVLHIHTSNNLVCLQIALATTPVSTKLCICVQ